MTIRPLSPHLQIYRLTITMVVSILHRISGAALYLGVALMAWFLIAVARGPEAFALFSGFIHSIVGRAALFGFSWALFHHMLGGVRHLIWDSGRGLDAPERDQLAWGGVIGGFVLTIAVWAIGYWVR